MTLRTWLLTSHLLVFALPIAVLLGSGALARDLLRQTQADLEHQGALLAILASDLVAHQREHDPGADIGQVGQALSSRLRKTKAATLSGIRVVDKTGLVIATSGQVLGEDLSADEEIQRALAGETYVVLKPRAPANLPLSSESRRAAVRVFVAVPIEVDGQVLGALVLSRTPREELQTLYEMAPGKLLGGTVLALCATLAGGFWMGFLLTGSLRTVASSTSRIAEGSFEGIGDLKQPVQSHVADVAVLASSVRTMAERLQQRLGYISEFASNVSHEFKTPLSTLKGTVELLADDDGSMPQAQRERFLKNAEAELDRLQRLVDGLLALARAEEGSHRESLDLDGVIAQVAGRHPGVAVEGRAGVVVASRTQLEAVLDNLVSNALRYGAAPVRIRAFRDAGAAGFEVSDGGPGISEANRALVFDRFFTTGRDAGGTGLGLALVRAVVEAHGGSVGLETGPGRTAFRIRLPVQLPAA